VAIDWEKINSAFKAEAEPAKAAASGERPTDKKIDRICGFIPDLFRSNKFLMNAANSVYFAMGVYLYRQ
jgi:hypothetical protein